MRVAIVCYYSPPQPAIASHRVLRMSRALLAAGHEVHWVAADPDRFPSSKLDATLADFIPKSVTRHGIDGQALISKPAADNLWEKVQRNIVWHLPRHFRYADGFFSWQRQLKKRLPGIVRDHGIDAVLLCCSPHNQILALPRLRRACPNLKIFVDYRDLLSGNPWNPRANPRQAQKILELERSVLRHADTLFVNTDEAARRFADQVGPIDGLEVTVMRNAADYDLAGEIAESVAPPEFGAGVHLGFFGTLFPRRRLAPVLAAISALPESARARLRLHVYCDPRDSQRLLEEDLAQVPEDVAQLVTRRDYVPWAQAQRTMQAMDALVLVNGGDAEDAVFVPGKLYDYVMARRPVLFVGYPGEAEGMIARTTGADWCHPYGATDDVARVLDGLLACRPADLPPAEEFVPATSFAPLLARLD